METSNTFISKLWFYIYKSIKNTAGVNFTNILRAAFVPTFLRQKSTNLKSKYKKASRETFVQKSRAYNVGEIDTRFIDDPSYLDGETEWEWNGDENENDREEGEKMGADSRAFITRWKRNELHFKNFFFEKKQIKNV